MDLSATNVIQENKGETKTNIVVKGRKMRRKFDFTPERYSVAFRVVVGIIAVATAILGIYLSFQFFEIESLKHAWVGIFLGILFAALQYTMWHGAGGNHILFLFGFASLYYGIRANIVTLMNIAPDAPVDVLWVGGIAIEVLPEFLLMYALFGDKMPNLVLKIASYIREGRGGRQRGGGGEGNLRRVINDNDSIVNLPYKAVYLCRNCGGLHLTKDCPSVNRTRRIVRPAMATRKPIDRT